MFGALPEVEVDDDTEEDVVVWELVDEEELLTVGETREEEEEITEEAREEVRELVVEEEDEEVEVEVELEIAKYPATTAKMTTTTTMRAITVLAIPLRELDDGSIGWALQNNLYLRLHSAFLIA